MNPALGRFGMMDPMVEKYYSVSPYIYCLDNPMKFIDPAGRWVIGTDGKRVIYNPQTGWSENTAADVKRVEIRY